MCRMRSLGCSPCTGAIESGATTLEEIVADRAAFRWLSVVVLIGN